jgi:hypothetical protein
VSPVTTGIMTAIGDVVRIMTIAMMGTKVTSIESFRASGNLHTIKCKFKMPRCKECVQKLCALWCRAHLPELVIKV